MSLGAPNDKWVVSSPNQLPLLNNRSGSDSDEEAEQKGTLQGAVVQSHANAGLMQTDSWWTRGNVTSRVALKGADKDTRFYLSIMDASTKNPFKIMHRALHYVKLNVSGQTVYANINSISKRLLLSKDEINQAAIKGDLENVIKTRMDFLSQHKEFLDTFRFEGGDYSEDRAFIVKATSERVVSDIQQLFQGIYHTKEAVYLTEGNDKNRMIFTTQGTTLVGQGSFSTVYKGDTIKEGQRTLNDVVVKVAHFRLHSASTESVIWETESQKEKENSALRDATNEQRTLQYLNERGLGTFVQGPIKTIKAIKDTIGNKVEVFTVTDFISGVPLNKLLNPLTPMQTVKLNIQLLQMFKEYCLKGQVYHGDLKPENMMLTKERRLKVIDWAGSTILDKTNQQIDLDSFKLKKMYTKQYLATIPEYALAQQRGIAALEQMQKHEYNAIDALNKGNRSTHDFYSQLALEQRNLAIRCRNKMYDLAKQLDFKALTMVMAELTSGLRRKKNIPFDIKQFLAGLPQASSIDQARLNLLVEMSNMTATPENIDLLIKKWEALIPQYELQAKMA